MTLMESIRYLWRNRKGKPPELLGPICACGQRISDPANALKFDGGLFHARCWMLVPTIWRRGGAI